MADTSLDQTRSELAQATDAGESLAGSLADLNNLSKTFGQSITTAFKGAVVQGKSLDTVLRSIGERLTGRALDAALAPLSGALASGASSLMGSLTKALGFAHGGVFAGGRVTPFASGGVVAAPTWFPMRGGAGLMGEAGPEAIVPLSRGADGRLGIAAHGGGGTAATHVTINVTTPDATSFRRSEAQVTSMLARAVGRGRRGL
ncbi:MAG: phage tail tape measure protein [Siculibacillus sp.]